MLMFRDSHFDGLLADTPDLHTRCHRLRYQVYCVEHAYEPREQPVPGEEHDAWDSAAVAFLLTHRASGVDVGTVRLVLAARPERLPFRQAMAGHPLHLPECRGQVAEVSRLAVSKTFRRRVEDTHAPWNHPLERPLQDGAPAHPGPLFGLLRCLYAWCHEAGIPGWCAMMEPALARRLAGIGIVGEVLGPVVDHHGRRAPYHFPLAAAEARLRAQQPALWAYITGGGEPAAAAEATQRRRRTGV